MRGFVPLLAALCVAGQPGPALAKDFYVDPQTGSATGDGSAAKPWKTIQEVITANLVETQGWASLPYTAGAQLVPKNAGAPIKAGDTIYLRSGYHGELSITGHYNSGVITIAAQAGHTPQLKSVLVRSSKNWVLRGLHVSPSFAPTYDNKTMVSVESHSYQGPLELVTVESCVLQSVADSSSWTASDWDTKAANGISAGGTKVTLSKNQLKNVNFGISVGATYSQVEHNTIENFSGDGLRGLGDHTVFEYNTVKNCYDVNANHDDGFQSWSVGSGGVGTGQVTGVVLRGNTIINYTNPNQPHRGTLQGIGMFDGTFVDWVIENNVVITDHWHGITLLGATNCRVVNNTVIDPNTVTPGPPWIEIGAHKNGTPPSGCVVRNNLATDFQSASTGVTEDHNITVTTLGTHFVNPGGYDLHLLATSPAIDKGSSQLAPKTDIEGTPRPQGSAVDVGAYEWTTPGPKPDASVTPDAAPPKPDTSAPKPDASAPKPDASAPKPDASAPKQDKGTPPPGDGPTPPPGDGPTPPPGDGPTPPPGDASTEDASGDGPVAGADAPPAATDGPAATGDAGSSGKLEGGSGCSCRVRVGRGSASGDVAWLVLMVALGLALRRRRRR